MKKLLILSLAILMVVGLSGAAIAAPLITGFGFDTGGSSYENNITLPLNGSVSIDLFAIFSSTVGDATTYALSGFDFVLGFNPAQLQVTSVSTDSNWSFFPVNTFDNNVGTVTMGGSSLASDRPTDALLGNIVFECIALGTSDITLASISGGPTGAADFVFNPNSISVAFNNATIGSISNVPIPGSILLLGSGILGLVGLSRRKRS